MAAKLTSTEKAALAGQALALSALTKGKTEEGTRALLEAMRETLDCTLDARKNRRTIVGAKNSTFDEGVRMLTVETSQAKRIAKFTAQGVFIADIVDAVVPV